MSRHPSILFRSALLCALCCLLAAGAMARPRPSSDLLLPCFEVRLDNSVTTVFAVGNSGLDSVKVHVSLLTNWGLEVFKTTLTLGPGQVQSVNLYDWLVLGQLPNGTLTPATIERLQTTLCGEPASSNGFYFSTMFDPADPEMAVGAVLIQSDDGRIHPDVLWGDYFVIDAAENYAQGDVLVDVDPDASGNALCKHHVLRFLEGGAFDAGTMVMLWNPSRLNDRNEGQASPFYPEYLMAEAKGRAFDEKGRPLGQRTLALHPLEMVKVSDLGLSKPFGWFDVVTDEPTYISMHYRADERYAAGLEAHCLDPLPPPAIGPQVTLEKRTQGLDADLPPGPTIPAGADVDWTYVVINTGDMLLYRIEVTDDRGVEIRCPRADLEPGESMTCTGSGVAEECQYLNLGRVVAQGVDGGVATAMDASYYFGRPDAAIDLEKHTQDTDNDKPPGPGIPVGSRVEWSYVVTNIGSEPLFDVEVTDDDVDVDITCPRSWLAPGETITCRAEGTAIQGPYRNLGRVTAEGPCNLVVSDTDPEHYTGVGQ